MTRRKGLIADIARAQRAFEAAHRRQLRAQTKAAREAERAEKAYWQAQKSELKERARLYAESRVAAVALKNENLEQDIAQLEGLLAATLSVDDYIDLEKQKQVPRIPVFDPNVKKPVLETYLPPELSGWKKLLPGAKKRHTEVVALSQREFEKALAFYDQAEAKHKRQVAEARDQAAKFNAKIEEFQRDFAAGLPEAIVNYFTLVLQASSYPDGFPQKAKIAYVPESKQLVVEYDLPPYEVIPEVASYKYVKTKDEITTTPRPETKRKALYASVTSQIALRTLHELFEADRTGQLETIVFNGYVDSIDRSTGRPARTCLVTVRTTRDTFMQIDLGKVDPIACLKGLNASVSKSPAELAPVRPVLEFNMVDSRFVEETDVISTLDQRPNLMELTPSEFESLITNLFEKMGLETRQTQASRDGGVDCVAYDPRPVLGGKVVIQAKRYKNPVGVSAVRDLFGTMHNEGASKGILVTTSGYGKAAFEFAEGKPLELLSGSHLLHLLAEHAGIEAKIVPPDNWKDPEPDTAET